MKVTKKQIRAAIKSGNRTEIFKLAKLSGVDVTNKSRVHDFMEAVVLTRKDWNKIYDLAYGKRKIEQGFKENRILEAITFAKHQKASGSMEGSYGKILIEGNGNIYWASPVYKHSDYNKSVAFENTEKNRALANTINRYLA